MFFYIGYMIYYMNKVIEIGFDIIYDVDFMFLKNFFYWGVFYNVRYFYNIF